MTVSPSRSVNVTWAVSTSSVFGDVESNAPEQWDWGYGSDVPHVLVMLFAKPGLLDDWVRRTLGDAWHEGFEETRRLTTSHLDGVEPFGFTDGISQPAVDWEQRRDPSEGGGRYDNEVALGEFLLGYRNEYGKYTDRPLIDVDLSSTGLPLAEEVPGKWDVGRNGTYLVIRQLKQDVHGFWQFVTSRAGGDRQAAETLAQLEKDAIPRVAGKAQERRLNSFTFDDDPAGVRCPFGAHIRRANPRNGDYAHHETGLKQRLAQLSGLHEDVEGEVDAGATGVGQEAGLLQLVHGELRPVVAGVESLGAEIYGVGPVGEGGPGGVEGARRGKQLWNWSVHGAQL